MNENKDDIPITQLLHRAMLIPVENLHKNIE